MLVSIALLGCNKDPQQEFTTDVRIDMADDQNNPDSFGTEMCVTDDGVVYVLWLDDRDDPDSKNYDIWMNRSVNRGGIDPDNGFADETGWLPAPVKVNQGDGNVWNPSMYCNELGVFVVWEDDRDGELESHQIYFNRSIDQGESFEPEDAILERDPDGLSMSLEPKIEGVGQDLFVVWYDSLNGAYDILVNSSGDAGKTWRTDPVRVDSDDPAGSAYSARPQMAVGDNADDVWVVWEDSRYGKADVYFGRSTSGGVDFEEDRRIDDGDDDGQADSFEPQICADPAGSIYVVWHDARNGEGRDVFLNHSGDGGSDWLANAERVDSDNAGFANSLYPVCVAVGAEAHVAWQDNRNGGYDIFYRRANDGILGNEEVRLDQGTPEGFANSLDTRIATDVGTVAVAWRDGRGEAEAGTNNGYDDLYYNYSENGGPFLTNPDNQEGEGDLRIDSMYDGQSFKVDVNFAILGGEWYAAWTDGRGGTSDIYFQRMPLGTEAVPPPQEAVEEQAAEQ